MIFDCIAFIVRKLIGIELEKRTDLISFVALTFSISATVISAALFIHGYFTGAKVDIYPDDQVLITKEDCGRGDGDECLRLGATVAFSNSGQIGYDTVLRQILIALKFSDESEYEQEWYEFVTFKNKNGKLIKGEEGLAVPLPIRAGNSLSRDIYFAPFRKPDCPAGEKADCEWDNYLKWDDFLKKLVVRENIKVTITAKSLDQEILDQESCRVDIDQHLINRLKEPNGWQSPSCWLLE